MPAKKLPSPTALAFIICDSIIEDKATNKKSLVGLFNSIATKTFPCIHSVIHVFVGLTGGHGRYQSALSCVKDDDESVKILDLQGLIKFSDPLEIVEVNFEIRDVRFPEAGIYRFELSCNDIPVISRKFQVVQRGKSR